MKLNNNSICTLEDWFRIAPPKSGIKQWKDGRSAKELARYITSSLPDVPSEMETVLSYFVSTDSAFEWAAEYETKFSSHGLGRGEGRYHDMILVNNELFVGIEGKADESLGSQYIGTALVGASGNKQHRITAMIDMLYGDSPENHMDIRYQLITAACATLLEATERKLNKALLMVLIFKKEGCYSDEKIMRNEKDMSFFLEHSKAIKAGDGDYWLVPTVYGKKHVIDLYFSRITIDVP